MGLVVVLGDTVNLVELVGAGYLVVLGDLGEQEHLVVLRDLVGTTKIEEWGAQEVH